MKRVLLLLVILSLMLCGFAHAELAAPQNPGWKEGSTATAMWDAVAGADYYLLNVHVYSDGTELGSAETGTSLTEVDVQLEANTVIKQQNTEYNAVQIAYTVKAGVTGSDGVITYGAESAMSSLWSYEFALIQLQPPENILLNADGTISWSTVDNARGYNLSVDACSGEDLSSSFAGSNVYVSSDEAGNDTPIYDLADTLKHLYKTGVENGRIAAGESIKVYVKIKAHADTSGLYVDSAYSSPSNAIDYVISDIIQLQPPESILLNTDGTISWSAVENARGYNLSVDACSGEDLSSLFTSSNVYVSSDEAGNDTPMYDLADIIKAIYKTGVENGRVAAGESIKVYVSIKAHGDTSGLYVDSAYSAPSNAIDYAISDTIQLQPPENILLNADGTISWSAVENARGYNLSVDACSGEDLSSLFTSSSVYVSSDEAGNDTPMYDLADIIKAIYKTGVENGRIAAGESIKVYVSIKAHGDTSGLYVDSAYSSPSNAIDYIPFIPVETLTLSPAEPVVYAGNSYYLGITITPDDAYFNSADWSSTDAGIVSVDSAGLITGISVGEAQVSAAIGEASCTVPVRVYDISSNIEDEEDNEEVKDTAGGIIDDLVNNDNPDLGNTDIDEEEREEIRDEVCEGIWRGDEFFTDMKWYEENFGKYKNNWGQIQKAARKLNAQFAGIYTIEVEMYHKDKDGTEYHIGCIEEFENEIAFTFDLPTGMDEIRDGYARKYVLVRIHRNEIDTIDVDVENENCKAQSDRFSDFILLYADEPTQPVDFTGMDTLTLPASLTEIKQEAFDGIAAEVIIVPESCTSIGSRAFTDCRNLKYIVLSPNSDITPANDAFEGCDAEIIYQ